MTFNEREKAFEDKFAHDEEVMFKIRARRNREVGLWAAREMGKSGLDADNYARELVVGMLDKESLLGKLRDDFAKSGKNITEAELFNHVSGFVAEARKHFMESQDDISSNA